MSPVLKRYLAREVFASTGLVLVAFLGLFAFFDFVNELEDIGKQGYELYHAFIYVLMTLPGRVYELLPIAVLIGTLYALTTLARHSEITVMRASGLSNLAMMRMLAQVGAVFVVLTFVFGEYIAPPAESAAQQWRLVATNSTVSQQLRSGLWVKDGPRIVNVRTLRADRSMERVRIFEFDAENQMASASEAASGAYDRQEGVWRLRDVVSTRFTDEATTVERQEELVWRSELTPEVLSVLMISPERMSVVALYAYIRHLQENRQSTERYEIALWKKLTYPLATLVMMALALPFAFMHDRMGAVSVKVFLGIMLGIGFQLLNGLFSNLGVINAWPPVMAALTPALIFLLAAGALLYLVERR
ncbi:LPS export ABC transporter permease LptG [Pseudothauera nasutitermitis]|uniref:LPS export ABC transporter permease LptG n=1 Tax=Pseudothauera nasutitermitis TaxID=2565930 RepID=A0A4S4AQQ0_9RHOO|nr:LPS export ABC transporter permease LptG [Pseudothauera nasutitermitis]THF61517.1 LPS export ABC transporter permease LptG [Pseudothauera nasutitermitis]